VRCQILDVLELEKKGPENPVVAEGLGGTLQFLTDLCHVQAGRAAGVMTCLFGRIDAPVEADIVIDNFRELARRLEKPAE
jgi:hypothetical protein